MGQAIERLAIEAGHEVVMRATSQAPIAPAHLKGADVAIEFTEPSSAVSNIFACFDAGVPVVCGTTGWFGRLPEVKARCAESGGTLFYASNYSIGVNLYFAMVRAAARMMRNYQQYTPSIHEIHHVKKKDAPSGTAITLAELLQDELTQFDGWTDHPAGEAEKIRITSLREGDVKGTHEVLFSSPTDEIELTHRAHSRDGFALGAIRAAEWVYTKKGCYHMADLLQNDLK